MTGTTRDIAGACGVVSTSHWLATQAAMSVLESGGNAVDAAVTAGFVMTVVAPHRCGVGGDVLALVSDKNKRRYVVSGIGTAPAAAEPTFFIDKGLTSIPVNGLTAAAVPGAIGGFMELLRRWGTHTPHQVMKPASQYATNGVPITSQMLSVIKKFGPLFADFWTSSAQTYFVRGAHLPPIGSALKRPDIAAVFDTIATQSGDREAQCAATAQAFYQGQPAEKIASFCDQTQWYDGSGLRNGGLLTATDLSSWSVSVEQARTISRDGFTFTSTNPHTQGTAVLLALNILDCLDVPTDLLDTDPSWVHLVIETLKLVQADREGWFGDPHTNTIAIDQLLSDEYARQRAEMISENDASFELRPGRLDDHPARIAGPVGAESDGANFETSPDVAQSLQTFTPATPTGDGKQAAFLSNSTTGPDGAAITVVDSEGMTVTLTVSGGALWQSPVVPGLGFNLGSSLRSMRLATGLTSTVRAGTRPFTAVAPLIVQQDDEPATVLSTTVDEGAFAAQVVTALRIVHDAGGQKLQQDISRPQLDSRHVPCLSARHPGSPGQVILEAHWSAPVVDHLRGLGHDIRLISQLPSCGLGGVSGGNEFWWAASDLRNGESSAAGR